MKDLLPGALFFVFGAVVLTMPVVAIKVASGDNAVSRFLKRHPQTSPALQVVCWATILLSNLASDHREPWLILLALLGLSINVAGVAVALRAANIPRD